MDSRLRHGCIRSSPSRFPSSKTKPLKAFARFCLLANLCLFERQMVFHRLPFTYSTFRMHLKLGSRYSATKVFSFVYDCTTDTKNLFIFRVYFANAESFNTGCISSAFISSHFRFTNSSSLIFVIHFFTNFDRILQHHYFFYNASP